MGQGGRQVRFDGIQRHSKSRRCFCAVRFLRTNIPLAALRHPPVGGVPQCLAIGWLGWWWPHADEASPRGAWGQMRHNSNWNWNSAAAPLPTTPRHPGIPAPRRLMNNACPAVAADSGRWLLTSSRTYPSCFIRTHREARFRRRRRLVVFPSFVGLRSPRSSLPASSSPVSSSSASPSGAWLCSRRPPGGRAARPTARTSPTTASWPGWSFFCADCAAALRSRFCS